MPRTRTSGWSPARVAFTPPSVSRVVCHTTQDAYNLLYEPVSTTLPDGTSTETRKYDAQGNLTSLTNFNGDTTTYSYDQMNRLLSRSTPGEATVSFTYTASGQRASMTDASGTTNRLLRVEGDPDMRRRRRHQLHLAVVHPVGTNITCFRSNSAGGSGPNLFKWI